jgi:hypothetical protein
VLILTSSILGRVARRHAAPVGLPCCVSRSKLSISYSDRNFHHGHTYSTRSKKTTHAWHGDNTNDFACEPKCEELEGNRAELLFLDEQS